LIESLSADAEKEFRMICPEMNKPTSWNRRALAGTWHVTLKVDGVRAIWHDNYGWISRAGKPLYHIPPYQGGPRDCELYVGSFRDTIRATRTKFKKTDTPTILHEHLFGLDILDERLNAGAMRNPSVDDVFAKLSAAQASGFEGIVLRQGDRWIKVKPHETHDVPITGFVEGRGKHAGRLGIITTPLGNVGSGFLDEERIELWAEAHAGTLVGQVVEISFMERTTTGKFRHPVFVRMRPDKVHGQNGR
jgi:ATP-dependent DNA ligase